MLLQFPRHVRASADSKPKTSGLASLPSGLKASAKISDFSAGIRPRDRQLLTPGGEMPASLAASNVPPTASITSAAVSKMVPSGVSRMVHDSSHAVNVSSLHDLAVECPLVPGDNFPMPIRL